MFYAQNIQYINSHVCELFGEFLLEGRVTIMLVVNHQVSTDCE